MIILDTDTCIEVLRGNKGLILLLQNIEEIKAISFMTYGELMYGAHLSNNIESNIDLIRSFSQNLFVVESDSKIMDLFGKIKSALRKSGNIIPDADLLIAATALAHNCALLTGNISHFERIPSLDIQDWRKSI